jgi:hypothetical protein
VKGGTVIVTVPAASGPATVGVWAAGYVIDPLTRRQPLNQALVKVKVVTPTAHVESLIVKAVNTLGL